jgi:uncharacterized protein (DUF2141 family)
MKGAGIAADAKTAQKGAIELNFNNLMQGSYAIMVLHDMNDNKQMDYETSGMPLESYATSGENTKMGPAILDFGKMI